MLKFGALADGFGKLLTRTLLVCGSAAAGLLLFELALAAWGHSLRETWIAWAVWDLPGSYYRLDSQRIWAIKSFHKNPWGRYESDADGLRLNPFVPEVSPEPAYRIVLAGDSFTFGYGVPGHQTIAVYLQDLLRGKNYDVRVMNAGVPGYGPGQAYIFLRDVVIPRCRPDLVVWNFDYSDSRDMESRSLHLLLGGRLLRVPGWTHGMYLSGRIQRIFRDRGPFPRTYRFLLNALPNFNPTRPVYRGNEGLALRTVRAMVQDVEKRMDGRLVVAEVPALPILTDDKERAADNGRVRRFYLGLEETARNFLPANARVAGALASRGGTRAEDLFFKKEEDVHRHLNPRGNAFFAGVLADHFESSGIARRFPAVRKAGAPAARGMN